MAEQKRKQEEEEMSEIAKKRKAEKLDDKMAMDKVKKLLAEDKEKRRLKNEEEMAKGTRPNSDCSFYEQLIMTPPSYGNSIFT